MEPNRLTPPRERLGDGDGGVRRCDADAGQRRLNEQGMG